MKHVYIIGTCDTKHTEILYVRNLLFSHGISTCIVDVGIYERMLPPDIGNVVHLREKQLDVFADITDRGKALALMGTLLEEFLVEHQKRYQRSNRTRRFRQYGHRDTRHARSACGTP